MITDIFNTLKTIADAFIGFLKDLFENVVDLIYTPGEGNAAGSLTVLGTLLLIGLATGLVMWAFYFIRSLIRVHRG